MNRHTEILGLAAVSAFLFAVPATAPALVSVHINPKPTGTPKIAGGTATLSTVGGSSVVCKEVSGSTTWESSTTGSMNLTFKNDCTATVGFTVSCTEIKVTAAPFHITGFVGKPAVLVTPPAGGVFAKFTCAGIFSFEVKGNGVVGTITSPPCATETETAKISFQGAAGFQNDKTVDHTETIYSLTSNGEQAAENALGTLTFSEGKRKLECTG